MRDAFFDATNNALQNITNTYDMIWPIAVGLWNLRCSVNGIKSEVPNITEKQLTAKFTEGSGIHGVNYKNAFTVRTWNEQQCDIAWLLLNSIIPVFEGWLEELHALFPSMDVLRMQQHQNINAEITKLTTPKSAIMDAEFYPRYQVRKKRKYSCLVNYLKCFRFFKEMRNCYMHNGCIADQKLIKAYQAFSSVATKSDLDVKEVPEFFAPTLGSPIQISLRGVVGFGDILIRIIATVDAELTRSVEAERLFESRFQNSSGFGRTLKASQDDANRQVKSYLSKIHMPIPVSVDPVRNHLLNRGLVRR